MFAISLFATSKPSAAAFLAENWLVVTTVLVALFFFMLIVFVAKRYKRCPPNRVLVIFGKVRKGDAAKCISGGADFVWPLVQDYAYLSLEPIQIEIPLKDALSIENIRISVPSVFTVAIGTDPEFMQNAAIRLLGLNGVQVKQQAQDIIFGQLRQVIASMRIEEINRDREKFLHSIQQSLEPELKKIGLVLINVNITDLMDESGYIEAIGQKAASQAIQQARGDVAEQLKLGETRVAEAERDKIVQVANANKTREIGMREAMREQAVRVAQLEKEQNVGEQTAGYEKDAQVKDAERQMRISVADANAKAIAGEATAQAAIAATQAQLQVKQAEAYQMGETRKREAEAAVQEAQNRAQAKAAIAQAERVEAERRAALEAPAKAEKAKTIVEAEAEAQKRRIEAEGEAQAIFARLEAEAKGQYEILAKKGEGLKRIIEACGGAQQAFQMMLLEHIDNLAQSSAHAISNIKFDKVVVWEGGNGTANGTSNTSNFLQSLARTMPPILHVMKDIGGVEVPEYFARLAGEGRTPDSTAAASGPSPGSPPAPTVPPVVTAAPESPASPAKEPNPKRGPERDKAGIGPRPGAARLAVRTAPLIGPPSVRDRIAVDPSNLLNRQDVRNAANRPADRAFSLSSKESCEADRCAMPISIMADVTGSPFMPHTQLWEGRAMLGVERNEYGFPFFDVCLAERDRPHFHDFLDRLARHRRQFGMHADENIADWERHWIDIGGEG